MKKIINILCLCFIILVIVVILVIILLTISRNIKKSQYRLEVTEYLSNKYSEQMIIKKIGFYELGNCAYISPYSNQEIIFPVIMNAEDRYLERCLEYDAEQMIYKQFSSCECKAEMANMVSVSVHNDELYDLYKKIGAPPRWSDVKDNVKLHKIRIDSENFTTQSKQEVIMFIQTALFRTSYIELYDGNEITTYKLQESGKYEQVHGIG